MHPRSSGFIHHGVAHEESVQEYVGGRERHLGKLQHDADLGDEVDALSAVLTLLLERHAIDGRRSVGEVLESKKPLILSGLQDRARRHRGHGRPEGDHDNYGESRDSRSVVC